ncbi:uncharacterized protein LOC115688124 [Syzygium oleosum]|uniref:uncharacterized protein LOC115688124 n=1 Tax=Syzygium oleosum TaxID=219896 RepID=UPI0011D28E6F|nr:uncharacterized protein LOC115688124 [Syzygium oleosum]
MSLPSNTWSVLRKKMTKVSVLFSVVVVLALLFVNGVLGRDRWHGFAKDGQVGIYELKKGNISLRLTNWGATIMSLLLPDKNGKLDDVVLGFDSVNDYKNDSAYFGSVVGRVANRIANAQFTLNGTRYKLIPNEGNNMLHGGPKGFSDVVWKVTRYQKGGHTPQIVFSYFSHNGEEGFPGDLQVSVTYTILSDNHLSISMKAKALNKATPVNLAQHAYWNLGGQNSGDILSEEVQIFASQITPCDSHLIPTGKIIPVKGTPYDFLEPHTIGSRINKLPNGYDINYVLNNAQGTKLHRAAIVRDKKSGRVMELVTNQPGVQFYTSNMIKEIKGKGGFVYKKHAALCLETQKYPDSVHHPNFPSEILYPGKSYEHVMLFKFTIES